MTHARPRPTLRRTKRPSGDATRGGNVRLNHRPALLGGTVLALSLAMWGCSGSARANAKASGDTTGRAETSMDAQGAWDTTEHTADEADTAAGQTLPAGAEIPLLGARHDVFLAEGASASCQCLAVVLGSPNAPGLIWAGKVPTIHPSTQWIIALSSEGVPCSASGSGASYRGYETRGSDVIVHVETAVAGRPITRGAIIPRPAAGGQVRLAPTGTIPYGRGLGGEAQCVVTPSP